jgi:hypothetical protein
MLSLIDRYSDKKECHILWTTRDRHMVKHFNSMLRKCHSTVWFTNKDFNAKQQFEQLEHTLNAPALKSVDANSSGTSSKVSSTITSKHSSTHDLSNAECGIGGTSSAFSAPTSSANICDDSNNRRDRATTDIVTLLEQGWPSHWNKQSNQHGGTTAASKVSSPSTDDGTYKPNNNTTTTDQVTPFTLKLFTLFTVTQRA